MKYPSLLLAMGLCLAVGCQGSQRTRPGPRGDAATMPDTSMSDAMDDADMEDSGVPGDGGSDAEVIDSGAADSSAMDTGTADTGPADSGAPDTGTPDTGPPTCAPTTGSLVIVEVMIASQSGSDQGEWFEVINADTCAIDLRGLVIGSPTTAGVPVTHMVTMGTVLPGAHFVFALSGDPVENHDLTWDYVYGMGVRADVFLGNAGDELTISYGGVELDRVVWTDADYTRGATLQYPHGASLSSSGDLSRWCDATRAYSSSGGELFLGTPGMRNDTCP